MFLSKFMSKKYGSGVHIIQRKMHLTSLYNFEMHDSIPPCSEFNKI